MPAAYVMTSAVQLRAGSICTYFSSVCLLPLTFCICFLAKLDFLFAHFLAPSFERLKVLLTQLPICLHRACLPDLDPRRGHDAMSTRDVFATPRADTCQSSDFVRLSNLFVAVLQDFVCKCGMLTT